MTDDPLENSDPWCAYLPLLHRALSDPTGGHALPDWNDLTGHRQFCAYWECVHYALHALLGWSHQARGLARWYNAGKPVDNSPVLALLKAHWDRDAMLDYYAAWAWAGQLCLLSPEDLSPAAMPAQATHGTEDWWRLLKRRGQRMQHDPLYGGTNPLHLGHSETFGYLDNPEPSSSALYRSPDHPMQAVLVVRSIASWRTELALSASSLPVVAGRSWRVKVFDTRVGFLGEYRQSRETGRWFTGLHSVHMLGH